MSDERKQDRLPGAVVWLGVVSLLTDASSEMIYPLLPQFLSQVLGAGREFVGLVEGVAEASASLVKLISGRLADRMPRKKPLTVLGYGLSSLARPLIAQASGPWMVLAVRFVDRIGKGVRGSPRDAMVAEVTPADRRGAAYGYHRAMDNSGAVLGPLIGFGLLAGLHAPFRMIFALAAIPAAGAMVALIFGVREPAKAAPPTATPPATAAAASAATGSHAARLRVYLVAVGLFTLGNSSDAFLILRARECGVGEAEVLLLWTAHNAMKALLSRRFGALSDRIGRRRLIAAGWLVYAATYAGLAWAEARWHAWLLFGLYGVYYALVEGSERALVADLAGARRRGAAFGAFHAIVGLGALPASLGFGFLYQRHGAPLAFTAAALLAVAALVPLALSRDRAG